MQSVPKNVFNSRFLDTICFSLAHSLMNRFKKKSMNANLQWLITILRTRVSPYGHWAQRSELKNKQNKNLFEMPLKVKKRLVKFFVYFLFITVDLIIIAITFV